MTNTKKNRWIVIFVLGLILVLALASCKPAPVATTVVVKEGSTVVDGDGDEQTYPDPQDDGSDANSPKTAEVEGSSTQVYPEPESNAPQTVEDVQAPTGDQPPPLKTEIVATDPSTVSLASGETQLIEFFAFW